MKARFGFVKYSILFVILSCGVLFAQNPTQPQPDVDTKTIHVHQLLPPIPPGGVTVGFTGAPGSSANSLYYWLVSNFTVGNSTVAGPYPAYFAPTTLTSSNYFTIYWQAVQGANSYDLLRTSTATPPTAACNCAVATGITGVSQTDQSNSLSSYTVNTYAATDAIQQLTSENVGGAGYANEHLLLKQKNTLVCDLSLCGVGSGVSSFSAGNLPPIFTTSVANPTTNPALSFILTNAAANTVFGNATGGSTAPSFGQIVTGQITNNAVNSSKLAVVNTTRTCEFDFGSDDPAAAVLTTAQIQPQLSKCQFDVPSTITQLVVKANAGASTIQIGYRHSSGGAPAVTNYTAAVLTPAVVTNITDTVACANTGGTAINIDGVAVTCGTLAASTGNQGDSVQTSAGTADGTSRRLAVFLTFTVN
ncbi:MAG: hypothetical protein ACRD20_02295 [Terriglobales bacterium]